MRDGAKVVINDIDEAPAKETIADIEKMGGKVETELVVPRPRADKGDAAAQYAAMGGKLPE